MLAVSAGSAVGSKTTLALSRTIVAGNTGGSPADLIAVSGGQVTDGGDNVLGHVTGVTAVGSDAVAVSDPKLAARANLGGPTDVMVPLPGSPALDRVPLADLGGDSRRPARRHPARRRGPGEVRRRGRGPAAERSDPVGGEPGVLAGLLRARPVTRGGVPCRFDAGGAGRVRWSLGLDRDARGLAWEVLLGAGVTILWAEVDPASGRVLRACLLY